RPPATRTDMPNPAPLKSPSLRLRLLAPGLAVLLAAGCATAPTTTSAPEYAAAIAQLEGGQPREAAGQLEAQAQAATGARRAALLADAAFAWREAGDEARARSLLSQVDARRVGAASKLRLALLNAELAVQDGRPGEAATALAGSDATTLSPAPQSRWPLASAAAPEAAGAARPAAAARLPRPSPAVTPPRCRRRCSRAGTWLRPPPRRRPAMSAQPPPRAPVPKPGWRATSARTTAARSTACWPRSTTPASAPTPPRCRKATRSTTSPRAPWSSVACRCRARSTAAKAGTSIRARRRPPTATDRRTASRCCCR